MHIVDNIETYCKSHNTSVSKFEESCELGHGTIRLWKLGTQMPSIRSLMKMANFTGIPIDQWTKEGGVA